MRLSRRSTSRLVGRGLDGVRLSRTVCLRLLLLLLLFIDLAKTNSNARKCSKLLQAAASFCSRCVCADFGMICEVLTAITASKSKAMCRQFRCWNDRIRVMKKNRIMSSKMKPHSPICKTPRCAFLCPFSLFLFLFFVFVFCFCFVFFFVIASFLLLCVRD